MKKIDQGVSDEMVNENGDSIMVKWLNNRSVSLVSNFVGCGVEDESPRWEGESLSCVRKLSVCIIILWVVSISGPNDWTL